MRLFLASLGTGDHPDRLVETVGAGARIGVVVNAVDDRPAADRTLATEVESDEMARLGLRPIALDLRAADVGARLDDLDAVWVRGGNTFVLRAALAASGADVAITDRVRSGTLAWAGYSAGAAVLSPDLRYVAAVDDPAAAGPTPPTDGLGLIDRPAVPHVDGSYDEALRCAELSARLTAEGIEHFRIGDRDSVMIVDGVVIAS
ncbi:Type 1 glutamine amidotransferase-like domain-containing protein [Williamsia deligens]|uniref:Type 1 glutamine amidotransferase-like domain-containing protein n=1 Tax=Williamsia deligens TaxID=321325 RepID=A0ABW3G5J4_9NOCA|nr:Type 1 glutamine amidotransferase-like domain-containing protein [Williamsia deligens]MCP2194866.1 dipeptidase E [Williamsia deligens]